MIFRHFQVKVEMAIGEVNSFVLGCSDTKEAVLVDVGRLDPAITEFVAAEGLTLRTIFITHNHGDHIHGVGDAVKEFGAEVVSGTELDGDYPVKIVGHGDEVKVGNLVGRVVSTPGHTPVGLSLIFPGIVFSGDALFAGSIGGTASEENKQEEISYIRENLFCLPGDYEIHSGHGPATTVAVESTHNPFFV